MSERNHLSGAKTNPRIGSRVSVALVGISGYGDSYLETLLNDPRAETVNVVGLVDPAPQRCRRLEELKSRNISIYPSLAGFLAEKQVELVFISSPIHFHASQSIASVETGAAVLCEKPLAGSYRDAQRLVRAHEACNTFIGIGYQWSFSPTIQALKADILSGAFGRPVKLKSFVSFPRGFTYFNRNDWAGRIKTPRGEEVLDSPVNNATAHYLHNMLYVLGKTREESAKPQSVQAELFRANDIENYDTAALRVMTASGTEILFYTTHAMADRVGPLAIYEFERGTIEFNADTAGVFVAKFADGTTKNYGNPNADRNQKIWHAAQALRGGAPVACHAGTAMPHMQCAVAAQLAPSGIVTFPADLRTKIDAGDDMMIVVRGLEHVLHDCFEREVLPSELGNVAWAKPSKAIEVSSLDAALAV